MKKLLLAHGEKLGMAIVVLVAGLVLYSSMGLEKLPPDKSPTQINNVAQQVNNKVASSTWESIRRDAPEAVKLYTPLAAKGKQELTPATYAVDRSGWDPAVVPPSTLRRDPALLPPTDFEGSGVTALFAFMSKEMLEKIALEEARRAAEREREMESERERALSEAERRPRGRRGPAAGGEGSFFGGGMGEIDPNNKNIREVGVTMRPAGVQLSGSELIEKMSCAVVVAKVPMTQQVEEYKKALAESRGYNPNVDYPDYMGYIVERAEVVPGQEELDWKPVQIRNGEKGGAPQKGVTELTLQRITADWVPAQPEIHDERYNHPLLTFPQPPLVGRDWGDMARHSEVPLASEVEPEDLDDPQGPAGTPESGDSDDLFAAPGTTGIGPGIRGEGRPSSGYGGRGYGGGGLGNFGRGGGEFGEGMMRGGGGVGRGGEMGGYGGGGYSPRAYTPKFNEAGEIELEVPFFMFRFFDLSVQPGRRYKYRVKLLIRDVNSSQVTANLEPEVIERLKGMSAKQKLNAFRYTEWSEPTPTISIPQAGVIMVAQPKPPTLTVGSEPSVQLVVESYGVDPENRNQAIQAYITTDARRGSVMNFFGQEVEKLIQQGRYIEKVQDFNIDTGITVLDIDGGERYTKEMNAPGTVLFMDPTGRMYLRDELEDERDVAYHNAVFNPPKNRPGSMGGEGAFGPEGRQRGGRGGGREFFE